MANTDKLLKLEAIDQIGSALNLYYQKKEDGKSLVDNDEITKLENIEANAQKNVIEQIEVNGSPVEVEDKKASIWVSTGSNNTDGIYHIRNGRSVSLGSILDNLGSSLYTAFDMIEEKISPYIPGNLYRTNFGSSNFYDPRINDWYWRNSGYNYVTIERTDDVRLLAFIIKDFTASNTEASAYENFEKDVELGNIVPIRIPESQGQPKIYDWDRNYQTIEVDLPVGSTFAPSITLGYVKGDIARYIGSGQSSTSITADDTSHGYWCVCGDMGWHIPDNDETEVALWISSDYTYNELGTYHFTVTFSNDRISEPLTIDLNLNIVESLPNWVDTPTTINQNIQYNTRINENLYVGALPGEAHPNHSYIDIISTNLDNLTNFTLDKFIHFEYNQVENRTEVYLKLESNRGIVDSDEIIQGDMNVRINVMGFNSNTTDIHLVVYRDITNYTNLVISKVNPAPEFYIDKNTNQIESIPANIDKTSCGLISPAYIYNFYDIIPTDVTLINSTNNKDILLDYNINPTFNIYGYQTIWLYTANFRGVEADRNYIGTYEYKVTFILNGVTKTFTLKFDIQDDPN